MASLDHAVPRSRGGSNEESNLLTVCWPCQFGRMDWTYEEVEIADPRTCAPHPRLADWKGLMP
jgi:5-methylcytosine-specific restriction endonuclease McrA